MSKLFSDLAEVNLENQLSSRGSWIPVKSSVHDPALDGVMKVEAEEKPVEASDRPTTNKSSAATDQDTQNQHVAKNQNATPDQEGAALPAATDHQSHHASQDEAATPHVDLHLSTSAVVMESGAKLLHQAGSSLGLTYKDNKLPLWKQLMKHKAQTGHVGLHFDDIFTAPETQTEVALRELHDTISTISADIDLTSEDYEEEERIKSDSKWQSSVPSDQKAEASTHQSHSIEKSHSTPNFAGRRQSFHKSSSVVTFSSQVSIAEEKEEKPAAGESLLRSVLARKKSQILSDSCQSQPEVTSATLSPVKSILKHSKDEETVMRESLHNLLPYEPDKELDESCLVYGPEALAHYHVFIKLEKRIEQEKLDEWRDTSLRRLEMKLDQVRNAMEGAREKIREGHTVRVMQGKSRNRSPGYQKGRSSMHIRTQLDALPMHRPYFIVTISVLLVLSIICIIGGITTIGLEPTLHLRSGVKTFIGTETVEHWSYPNVWVGPEARYLVGVGAIHAICMREDIATEVYYAQQEYGLQDDPLGCCEVAARNTAGTTTQNECKESTPVALWRPDVTCGKRPSGQNHVLHNLKPCCIGLKAHCVLVSHEHCVFLEGTFFSEGLEHCSQINCASNVCGLGNMTSDPNHPYKPADPNQWWRLPLSLLYHHGFIHLALVCLAQLVVGCPLERVAGWFRMMLLYLINGLIGLLMGAVLTPYQPTVGGGGAVTGLISVLIIELIQSWKLVQRPWWELAKLLVVIFFCLFSGTLPFINNFTLLGGLISGFLSGTVVLPYITLGAWTVRFRRILIAVCVPALLLLVIVICHVYVNVQGVSECKACQYFSCIEYVKDMCKITELW